MTASSPHRVPLEEAFAIEGRDFPGAMDGLCAYLDELQMWSSRANLTGFTSPVERVRLGVMDALPLCDALRPGIRLVDVGSGNGLPGMVVALVRPDVRVVLVEPSARRAAFLRTAASKAGATLDVRRCRVEDLEPSETFDAAVSRAVFEPVRWLRIAISLVPVGGEVFLMLGDGTAPEVPAGLKNAGSTSCGSWGGIAGHRMVRYVRVRE